MKVVSFIKPGRGTSSPGSSPPPGSQRGPRLPTPEPRPWRRSASSRTQATWSSSTTPAPSRPSGRTTDGQRGPRLSARYEPGAVGAGRFRGKCSPAAARAAQALRRRSWFRCFTPLSRAETETTSSRASPAAHLTRHPKSFVLSPGADRSSTESPARHVGCHSLT
jgi:hypothetical protein